mmetsp:Transcript_11001/g.13012  ORF Transcript_11001/g.13012 Transcript_11001/m.13012 type:complete len:92 (-) Transcript_11001:335-610(-)
MQYLERPGIANPVYRMMQRNDRKNMKEHDTTRIVAVCRFGIAVTLDRIVECTKKAGYTVCCIFGYVGGRVEVDPPADFEIGSDEYVGSYIG